MKDFKLMTAGGQLDAVNAVDTVAIVCSEVELTTLIDALDIAHREYGGVRDEDVYAAMRNDLEKLRKEAFGR